MKKIIILLTLLNLAIAYGTWIMPPEDFESGVIFDHSGSATSYWFAPTYHTPMYVYSAGFESDSAVGSGPMSWPDWWGNFIRSPLTNCSASDSVILTFRMWNTAWTNDFARLLTHD